MARDQRIDTISKAYFNISFKSYYYVLLAPITWLEWPLLKWLGLALMCAALVVMQ